MWRTLRTVRTLSLSLALAAMLGSPAAAQAPSPTLIDDLMDDLEQVEEKLVGLAKAMSAEQYGWRPGEGVRSVREVLLHVASDNYFLPGVWGASIPASTGITKGDFSSVMAYEKQQLGKNEVVAGLETSFAHLRKTLEELPRERMRESLSVFGRTFTVRQFVILTTTHIHEHLGQMIAYARMNGLVPPWSAGN